MNCCPMCGYRPGAPTDDGDKLPRRHRKAYRFMMIHLSDPELSVAALAEAACVTQRALQLAWKKHLGCSPNASIRRLRAEKIRLEIAASSKPLMKCAEKFGVLNRGALDKLFHDFFGCAPSALRGPADTQATRIERDTKPQRVMEECDVQG